MFPAFRSQRIPRVFSGFSFIEIMLSVALLLIIGTLSAFFSSRMIVTNAVTETGDFLAGSLEEARFDSKAGKDGGQWGVHIGLTAVTFFRGNSYASRDTGLDRILELNPNVTISGPKEVVFGRVSGLPNASGTVIVSGGGSSVSLVINDRGIVER